MRSVRDLAPAGAWRFIILLGVISLFSDITYEGARSISGPFLGQLKASALVVGVVAGLGEFLGYTLRLASGYLTDRLGRYWPIVFAGYAVNLLAVPLLALAGSWEIAVALLLVERMGKAVRTPARDAMLSHATASVGRGRGFGFHEAMDQIGAVTGPLIVAAVLYYRGGYREGFAVLLLPAVLALVVIAMAARLYPHPQHLEVNVPELNPTGFTRPYWLYVVAVGLLGAGYADFPLIAYHFGKTAVLPSDWIPLFYAVAMGVDAVAALVLGRLFDRLGMPVIMGTAVLSAFFAPLVFWGGFKLALLGMVLWGIGMGSLESIIKAALAEMVPRDRRATGFGLFNAGFGVFWLLGSVLMGFLYDFSLGALVAFSVTAQLLAIPFFLAVSRQVGLKPR
ncbi:MAG: MFS transporter [Desulfobacterales bacterium]|nr:MFS transporter [Pseudomonadota bacterium]MBU4355192.1 MFS transporter [Pseudomonadota bacterium]MCG2771711.1 MFS transporter [Desulfobacterales bacterium]